MSMSTSVHAAVGRSADRPLPGLRVEDPRDDASGGLSGPVVDVMFPLIDDEDWPPYPCEMLDAELIAHDLAEVRGVPWFVTNVSRGDIVKVRYDGIGYVGGVIVSRGGHSTVQVMATSEDELTPIVDRLAALGVGTHTGLVPPMLIVDVPETCSLAAVLEIMSEAESMTCAYTVACEQHRPRSFANGRLRQ